LKLIRVSKVTFENIEVFDNPRVRNEAQQALAKHIKDGLPSDDGGHSIRAQWFGPSEQINYFPQAVSQNRSPGEWYQMEEFVTQLRQANPDLSTIIKFEVTPVFSGASKRPVGFDVKVTKDGEVMALPNNQTYFNNPTQ